jgi:ribonuclease HII
VVAAAALLPATVDPKAHPWLGEINDSKCVTPECRERLAPLIEGWVPAFGVGEASVEEIDRLNIFHASHLAMIRALEAALAMARERGVEAAGGLHALVDGKFLPRGLPCPASAVVKADARCLSVAAASILAKVWRDRRMAELDRRFPGYGFASHKGYATPVHTQALKRLGPCELHRRSFSPVAELLALSKPSEEPSQLKLC